MSRPSKPSRFRTRRPAVGRKLASLRCELLEQRVVLSGLGLTTQLPPSTGGIDEFATPFSSQPVAANAVDAGGDLLVGNVPGFAAAAAVPANNGGVDLNARYIYRFGLSAADLNEDFFDSENPNSWRSRGYQPDMIREYNDGTNVLFSTRWSQIDSSRQAYFGMSLAQLNQRLLDFNDDYRVIDVQRAHTAQWTSSVCRRLGTNIRRNHFASACQPIKFPA